VELLKRAFAVKGPARKQRDIIKSHFADDLTVFWRDIYGQVESGLVDASKAADWSSLYMGIAASFVYDRNILSPERMGRIADDMQQPTFWMFAALDAAGATPDMGQTAVAEARAISHFSEDGEKVYEISPALAQRLAHTDVRGVDCANVRLPFPTIAFKVPPESGFDIHEVIIMETPAVPALDESMRRAFNKFLDKHNTLRRLNVPENTVPRCFTFFGARSSTLDDIIVSTFWLVDGMPIDEANRLQMSDPAHHTDVAQFTTFCMNAVLYLTWPDANEEFEERVNADWATAKKKVAQLNGYKKERAKVKLKTMYANRRIYVGAKVPFLSTPETDSGGGSPLLVRTLVSGHWKMQPCGPKQSERKLIRIEPFWRGPLDSPVTNAVRKVS
jgi:hypothetical protein